MHYPTTKTAKDELNRRVGSAHAKHIAHYVNNLQCSKEQKLKLIDAAADAIREKSQK